MRRGFLVTDEMSGCGHICLLDPQNRHCDPGLAAAEPIPARPRNWIASQRCGSHLARMAEALKPEVRQFLDYLESLNRPKGHEVGAEAARNMMLASRNAFEVPAR